MGKIGTKWKERNLNLFFSFGQTESVSLLEQVLLNLRWTKSGGEDSGSVPLQVHQSVVDSSHALLGVLSQVMLPEAFLSGVAALLDSPDPVIRRKVPFWGVLGVFQGF